MRIAIVTQPYYPQSGGVSEHVHHTATELRRLGHETHVVTSRFRTERDSANGVFRVGHNLMFPMLGALANINAGPHLVRDVDRILARNDYDVLHVHEPLTPFLPWVAVEQAPKDAVVVGTFHASSTRSTGYRMFRPLLRRFSERLDARIAVSNTARRHVARHFDAAYEVIPNGVDPERFHPRVTPLEEHASPRPTILFVGRFYRRKGVPVLFSALPRIVAAVPDVRVLVVGAGPLGPWLRTLGRRAPCDVEFLGELSHADIPRAYRTADVLVVPSTGHESFGIIHLEAMASGLPIVASDIEGYREVLDPGREALLFRNRDPRSLSDAVTKVLTDRELARAMAARGREKAQRYGWSRIARDLEALYLQLLDRRRRISLAS